MEGIARRLGQPRNLASVRNVWSYNMTRRSTYFRLGPQGDLSASAKGKKGANTHPVVSNTRSAGCTFLFGEGVLQGHPSQMVAVGWLVPAPRYSARAVPLTAS